MNNLAILADFVRLGIPIVTADDSIQLDWKDLLSFQQRLGKAGKVFDKTWKGERERASSRLITIKP